MNDAIKGARANILVLVLGGSLILPLVCYLGSLIDFGGDAAGDAMAYGLFVITVAPLLLAVLSIMISHIAKPHKQSLSVFYRNSWLIPWLGGVSILLAIAAVDSMGQITNLSVSNYSDKPIYEIKINGFKQPLNLSQIGPTHESGIGGHWGKLPSDITIQWKDVSGNNHDQSVTVPSPKASYNSIWLTLSLNEDQKWTYSFLRD